MDIEKKLEILEGIYKKIPEIRGSKVIGLPRVYFQKLSDLEFEILYTMPGLTIRIHPRTFQYIEERRIALKLPKAVTFDDKQSYKGDNIL
jgi:hypothetical protein